VGRATALGIVLATLIGAPALAAGPPELAPLAFLIGEWPASGAGQPGPASGRTVFAPELQGRILVRTSYAEYPAAAGRPASRHDDLMVVYAVPGAGTRADYYDSEGHVIRYVVNSPAPGQAVFLSERREGEPRYRLSYRLEPDGVLEGEFSIAPPDAPEAFKTYLSWTSRKAASKSVK
jgi:hypothetical protein